MAILVGDIHGNVEKAEAFLSFKPEAEHVALGDYLDSYSEPPSRQLKTLQLLLDSSAVLLWGNHDLAYLKIPPFGCPGVQPDAPYAPLIEANKFRFKAAYAVDSWLCTHAGVHVGITMHASNIDSLAGRLNRGLADYLKNPRSRHENIWARGRSRGGIARRGGIFWFDYLREIGLAMEFKQIFGHTPASQPIKGKTYLALNTDDDSRDCWLFDTSNDELVKIELSPRRMKY